MYVQCTSPNESNPVCYQVNNWIPFPFTASSTRHVKSVQFDTHLTKNCEQRQLVSSCPSVCPSTWKISAPTGRIFMKPDI